MGSTKKNKPAGRRGTARKSPQIISLSAPPLTELPKWGARFEFDDFFVELVPPGERVFNIRLRETFASINFGPAEGTSSLAGERLRRYERRPFEYIMAPPKFPLRGETKDAPEVLVYVIRFDEIHARLARALSVPLEAVNPQALRYINRLSDLLFVLSRYENDLGAADVLWIPGKNR